MRLYTILRRLASKLAFKNCMPTMNTTYAAPLIAYVHNGMVHLTIQLETALPVGLTNIGTVKSGFEPHQSIFGTFHTPNNGGDIGKVAWCRVLATGEIQLWVLSTLSSNEIIQFVYPYMGGELNP